MNDQLPMSATWMTEPPGETAGITAAVDRVLASDRDARQRERHMRILGLLGVLVLMPALLWAAAHGVTPLVRGAYALMAVGSTAIASAEWMYLAWSRQALPGPLDARSQLQLTRFLLTRQATLLKTAPAWSSPVFIGVALLGAWLFTNRTLSAAIVIWTIAVVSWIAAVWLTQSVVTRLRERQEQIDRLLADFQAPPSNEPTRSISSSRL